jgi:hypothetical protein
MVNLIRNAIALVGFGGAFCLMVARPFMPPELKPSVLPFAILLFGAPWLLIPIINKLFLGVYLPGSRLTPEQVDTIRQEARKDRRTNIVSAVYFAGVSIPMIFLMKEFSWSRNSAIEFGLVMSLFMTVIFSRIRAKYSRD